MVTRVFQIVGLLSLLAAIVLAAVAGGIEATRAARYYEHDPDTAGRPSIAADSQTVERWERTTGTIDRLLTLAAPLFVVGAGTCWIAWARQRSPAWALRRPGLRYSAARLCLHANPERRRRRRRSRRSHGHSESVQLIL
jgi:hypothetical protein